MLSYLVNPDRTPIRLPSPREIYRQGQAAPGSSDQLYVDGLQPDDLTAQCVESPALEAAWPLQ